MIIKPSFSVLSVWLESFINLVYPKTCCACGSLLMTDELHVCISCRMLLPRTRFYKHRENQLTKIFWGRIPLETGTALYFFYKGSKVQRLIHQFKYKGNTELGFFLGSLLGQDIKSSPNYAGINCIIPVPLHPKKKKQRGFNQSEVIARGIASCLSVPCYDYLLIRKQETSTQTRKNRYNRWQNVSDVFETPDTSQLVNKSVLLIDDVITTGSTLEACAQKLLAIKGLKIWIATLAITA